MRGRGDELVLLLMGDTPLETAQRLLVASAPKMRQASFDSEPRSPERQRDPARVPSLAKQSEQLLIFLWRPEPPPLPP